MNCLDLSNNDVQEWIVKEGIETTYKEFLDKGYLPDYKDWDGRISIPSAKILLDKFLPIDSFKIESLSNLLYSLPVETQAAYLNQVLYLTENPRKEEVYEEGFHAIFDTLLTSDEKKQALKAGQAVLANRLKKEGITINQYVKELVNKYPTIYGALKSDDRFNRAYEEELASMFVDSFEYKNEFNSEFELSKKLQPFFGDNAKSIASIINKVFNFFKKLFKMYDANRDTINTLFNQIKNGELKGRAIKGENSETVPATRLLNLYNTEYDDFLEEEVKSVTHALTSEETQRVIRNVGALFFQLESEKVLPDFDEKLDKAIELYFEFDSEFNNVDLNSVDNKESIDYLKSDIKDYIKTFSSLIDFEDETVESEDETSKEFAKYDSSANESSAFESSYSKQLKLRIGKTGKIKKYVDANGVLQTHFTKNINGKDVKLKLIESVDVIKVYYAFARSLGNTSNDEERFNRLLKFSELKDNSDTKAFVDQLLYDLFANNDAVKDITGENEYENKISKIKELYNLQAPGFIIFPKNDNDVTISSNNASIINSILKGFDLWKRTDIIVTFDALTKTAKAFDANLNNVQNTQVNQWFASIEDVYNQLNKDKEEGETIEFKFTKYNTFLGISSKQDLESVTEDIYSTLNKIGIKVSKDYIRYSVLSQSSKELLSDSDLATLLGNFKIPDTTILTPQVLEYIYTGINSYYSTGDIKSISTFNNKISIKGRLQDIAQGNGYFDENIPDNTFKGADGKTRYNYQYKTYHLQKIDEILKNPTNINTYKVLVAKDEYLEEGLDFIQNNYLFNKFGKEYKQQLDKGDIYSFSASGLRQQDTFKDANGKEIKIESDGESIGNMSNRDFMIYLLNLSAGLGTNSKGLLPVYFGNYEASKTYEFINLPVIKDLINEQGLTELGVQLFKTEIEKEYNRIKKLSKENIDTIYTKYNSGNRIKINNVDNTKSFYIPFNVKDGVRTINFANFRGQQFSDYVGGLVDDRHYNIPDEVLKELNTLINSNNEFEFTLTKDLNVGDNLLMNAILGNDIPDINNSIKTNVEDILNSTFNMFETEGIVEQVKDKQGKPVYSNGNPIYNNILLDSFYNGRTKNSLEFGFKVGDLQGNLKKTIVSSLLNTMYANQLMQGDQALLYKNDAVDMFKRFKSRNASIVSYKTLTIAPKYGIYKPWLTLDYVVHEEVQVKSGINLENIDQADAQNYTTVNYMRHSIYAMGRLSPEMANVLDAIEQGEDTSINDVNIIDQELYTAILKTVHADGRNYLKKSDFMLSKRLTSKFIKITEQEALLHGYEDNYGRWKPSIGATKEVVRWSDGSYHEVVPRQEKNTKGGALHDRRKVMEGWRFDNNQWVYNGREIMLSMPISASKMLNRNTLKGHDLKNVKDENINTLDLQYYGLQVETAKPHDKIPDPTQYLLIALNELNRKGITKFTIDNKEYNVNELEDLYEEALTARDNIRIDELKNDLKDEEEFRNRFAKALESSGAEKQTIDLVTKNFNLNNPLIKDKYIAQIFSHFTKDGLSQKRAGDAAPHVSSYGMKLIKKVVKHNVNGKDLWSWTVVPTDSDKYNSVPEGLKDLSEHDFYPDVNNIKHEKYTDNRLQDELEKLGEGQYFIDELRHLKPRVEGNKITGYFDEVILSKFDAKQKGIYDTQKYMFGVRIPSQDKHSGVNVEWVDMLPAHYGSVVSVPKEIVQLSGHDFDVDKLYISKQEGYYKNGEFYQYGNTFEDLKRYALNNNKKLQKEIKVLKDSDENYQRVKKEINVIKTTKQEAWAKLKEIEKDLENLPKEKLKLLNKLFKVKEEIEIIDSKIDYDLATKEDLLNRKELTAKLKNIYKFNDVKESDVTEDIKKYSKALENFYDLNTDSKKIELEIKIAELNVFTSLIETQALKTVGLPYDEITYKEYIKKYGFSNRGYINNILLQANQQALANEQTLNGGSADTAASMGYLANGVLKEFKLSDGTYLLSNDGKSYVNTNKVKYNVHSMLGHIITHKNNNTGKANIGIDVNWNLLDIVLNKLNVEVNPNNAITININGVDKTFGSLELFLQGETNLKRVYSDFINHSGGAKGGDMTWDLEGKNSGFLNHNHYTVNFYDKLKESEKEELNVQYLEAVKFLGRGIISKDSYAGKLVRRDMLQANKGFSIYGITELIKPQIKGRKGYVNKMNYSIPEGGTGYAIARGIILNKPVYVFNQSDKYGNEIGWYKWDINKNDFIKTETPTLSNNYTGIGSQEINELGKQAIKDVYDKTKKEIDNQPEFETKQGLRVFDVLSTMISSATDEAKEQLNARYGLNVDALNAVLPFVAMGGNLSIAIAIVNQPIVQDFLKYKSKKNYAVLTKDESQYKFISDDKIVSLMLNGKDYAQVLDSVGTYSEEYLAKGLRGENYVYDNQAINVLRDFLRLSEISQYGNNLIAAIKLSKGLPSDLYKFQSMVDKIKAIGLNDRNYDPSLVPLDIKNAILNNPSKSKSIVNKINIVNEIDGLLPQYIALKSALMTKYKQELLIQLGKENLGATIQREIDNELESFIYGQLVYKGLENAAEQDSLLLKHLRNTLIDSVAQENTIVQMFNNLKDYIVNVPELKENSLIKKLQVIDDGVISYLKLNQLVKLTDTQMTELSDAFTYLSNYPKEINGISPLEFTKALQALYIIKDGMQFKFEGISKVFPVESLSRIDKAINDVMKGDYKDLSNESYINEFIKRYFESIKHINSAKLSTIKTILQYAKEGVIYEVIDKENEAVKLVFYRKGIDPNKVGLNITSEKGYLKYINVDFGNKYPMRLTSVKDDFVIYEEYLPQGTSNSTLMSVPYNPVIEPSNLNTIDNNINEAKSSNFTENKQQSDETINIYAGTKENEDLSNFAIRPFTVNVETSLGEKTFTFQSVEQGFHFYKTVIADRPDIGKKILETTNGGTLKSLTNRYNLKLSQEKLKEWDEQSKSIMLNLMYDSFLQNPKALEKLLNTGNAKLTHKYKGVEQDNGRFSEVIMLVREMFKDDNNQSDDEFNICNE